MAKGIFSKPYQMQTLTLVVMRFLPPSIEPRYTISVSMQKLMHKMDGNFHCTLLENWFKKSNFTVWIENPRKSLIQNWERSKLRFHFEWTKFNEKCQKLSIWASFWKPEACGQTVLPDRSVLIGQKLVENAKIQNVKCDILSNFQTMWWTKNTVDYLFNAPLQINAQSKM